jgi:hypothetical protein
MNERELSTKRQQVAPGEDPGDVNEVKVCESCDLKRRVKRAPKCGKLSRAEIRRAIRRVKNV